MVGLRLNTYIHTHTHTHTHSHTLTANTHIANTHICVCIYIKPRASKLNYFALILPHCSVTTITPFVKVINLLFLI
jgi:hypothetical protein